MSRKSSNFTAQSCKYEKYCRNQKIPNAESANRKTKLKNFIVMTQKKAPRTFLQGAIEGMLKEEFDELVRIVQLSYWRYQEAVIIDGTNDGGCDIRVFQNKREIKKCIQITIQKYQIGTKIKNDLKKVSNMISQFGYSNKFEFYCSITISPEKIEEYRKYAIDEYDIELDIFDGKRLSQLENKEAINYIYSLHSDVVLKPEQMNIDRATKTLYDLLAHGKDSSDIKNSLVDSVIISIIYEKGSIGLPELKEELERRIGKNIPDIIHSVNILKSDQRIKSDEQNKKLLCLSDEEYNNVQEILALSAQTEKEFCLEFTNILSRYQIEYTPKLLEELKKLYKFYYSNDIDYHTKDDDDVYVKIFDKFKKYLLTLIHDKKCIDLLIADIKALCENNNYLNKISASESFLSLYKSNQLESYLNQRKKEIYLDTPTFVYLLCAYYGIERNDWENPFYRSMKSLINFKNTYSNKVNFYIIRDYLGEVAGEIKKALQYAKFEKYSFFNDLGGTRNTLYNYYDYLKNAKLFEIEDGIETFEDFMYNLGLDNLEPNDNRFINDTFSFLQDVADNYGIEVVDWYPDEKFSEIKESYERILLIHEKDRSETAIRNDVNQVITLLLNDSNSDVYLTTWDTTIHLLRNVILDNMNQGKYHYFDIYNPAKLSNKISLENFNIDESALTNEIFAYADKKYDISNRVKSLLEIIAPFLKNVNSGNNKLLKKLSRIRKEQLQDREPIKESKDEDKYLPVEEIVIRLIPSKEQIKQDAHIIDKFSIFMSIEENTDYIIDLIDKASKLKDFKHFDFSEYFSKVESVDLTMLDLK